MQIGGYVSAPPKVYINMLPKSLERRIPLQITDKHVPRPQRAVPHEINA